MNVCVCVGMRVTLKVRKREGGGRLKEYFYMHILLCIHSTGENIIVVRVGLIYKYETLMVSYISYCILSSK